MVLKTKNWQNLQLNKNLYFLSKNCNLGRLSYSRSLQPSKGNIQLFPDPKHCFEVQNSLQKFSRFLSQEGRLRSCLWFRFGRPYERTRNPPPHCGVHKAVTTTRANEVRELLVFLGGDGDTGLVGLHLADVVELRHPVAWLHKPFLQQKISFNQSLNELIKQNVTDIVSLLRTENTLRKLEMLIYLPTA
jgi:hypothetical protein